MPILRALVLTVLLLAAVVLQVSFFAWFALAGVVPNLVLLVVVAAGLVRGPEHAALLGLLGGLALDLTPPADGVVGRWALAMVLAGWLAGRVRQDSGRSSLVALATVAACSFVATSVYALSGMVLADLDHTALGVAEALRVIPLAVAYDVLLAPFVLPPVLRLCRSLQPPPVVAY